MEREKIMKLLFPLLFLSVLCISTPIKPLKSESSILSSQWKPLLEEKIKNDPEFISLKMNRELAEKKEQQSYLFWTPDLQLYGSQIATNENTSFYQKQLGLAAQLSLFQFGRDYHLWKSRQAGLEANQSAYEIAYIQIENQYLNLIFKNIYLTKKVDLYMEIESLKKKTLNVAEQRFERGNLPRQQVEKVSIDLANFESQRLSLEKELKENQFLIEKFELSELVKNWPFTELRDKEFSQLENNKSLYLKQLETEAIEAQQYYSYEKSQYWPSLDMNGRYYKLNDAADSSTQWELNLTLSWKLWDRFSQSLNSLEAYRKSSYADSRLIQYQRVFKEENRNAFSQLELAQRKLKKSFTSLSKLNNLYNDTEKLFSQGRLSVNELFQDQQLLMETKINIENDILDFHQNILNYCKQKSQRVWSCF